jgi:hypothetical protein
MGTIIEQQREQAVFLKVSGLLLGDHARAMPHHFYGL